MTLLKKLNLPIRHAVDLGTFSTNCLAHEAQKIFNYYTPINGIGWSTQPESKKAKECCGEFILNLCNRKPSRDYNYFSTTGSSESIFLAILLLKKNWQKRNRNKKEKLNLIIGNNSHISWIKAAHYLDVDLQIVPIDKEKLTMDFETLPLLINEKTIGVNCTLGSQSTLLFDQAQKCDTILEHYYKSSHHFIPLHIDAASGGFIAPFSHPNLNWGFKLNHVLSINVSSHKYGLVYPSLGWLLTDNQLFSENLAYESNYHGEPFKTFALHFSHSVAHLFTQYYYIQKLRHDGYREIISALFELTGTLKQELAQLEEIKIISPPSSYSLPGILFKKNPEKTNLNMDSLALKLKEKGWILPSYTLPYPTDKQQVGRIVIRYGFTPELINKLLKNIKECLKK